MDFNPQLYRQYFPINRGDLWRDWLSQPTGVTEDRSFLSAKKLPKLIVSMTSHPGRIATTWLAIESIMRGNVKPHCIILYLARDDFPAQSRKSIPTTLTILQKRGLEIRFTGINYFVATKLIPALKDFPNDTIVTADDDRIYDPRWLETLTNTARAHPKCIVCPHVRRYCKSSVDDPINDIKPTYPGGVRINAPVGYFIAWPPIDYTIQQPVYNKQIYGIFEGFAGVLYPPNCLHPDVFDIDQFRTLCPVADDIWFQVMAMRVGTKCVAPAQAISTILATCVEIDDTQTVGLFHAHLRANSIMLYETLRKFDITSLVGITTTGPIVCPHCRRTVAQAPYNKAAVDCWGCLNQNKRKILCVGAYDYGNIGDRIYKEIFQYCNAFAKFDIMTVPDTQRLSVDRTYISMNSTELDFEFDALVIGGGGILCDRMLAGSIGYYTNKARSNCLPYFIVSVGFQTSADAPSPIGHELAMMLKDAEIVSVRSSDDYSFIARSSNGGTGGTGGTGSTSGTGGTGGTGGTVGTNTTINNLYLRPDLGYFYPALTGGQRSDNPKYITLIQTGSCNINMPDVRDRIDALFIRYAAVRPRLIVLNFGGSENPTSAKDFAEYDLFKIDPKKYYRGVKVYMGDSISDQLRTDVYDNAIVRESDLTPLSALDIIGCSLHILTGRYHGYVLAKALGVPVDVLIYNYKCNAELRCALDISKASTVLDMIQQYLIGGCIIRKWDVWTDEYRNSMICMVSEKYTSISVEYCQAFDNRSLYEMIVFGGDILGGAGN